MTAVDARFPIQPRVGRKTIERLGPISDPQEHRAQHVHLWRVFGELKQCLLCQSLEADDD